MFHLFTHAFFKALLFLGAGSVIHAMHHEQDMRKMGGLRRRLPRTYVAMLIGAASLTGLPPLSGFFSKDQILGEATSGGTYGLVLFAVALTGVLLTAIYSFRLVFLVFHGEESEYARELLSKHEGREGPRWMTAPVLVLAVLAVVGGWLQISGLWEKFSDFLEPVVGMPIEVALSREWALSGMSVLLALTGIWTAWAVYVRRSQTAPRSPRFLLEKLYFDRLYDFLFYRPAAALARALTGLFERPVIDDSVDGIGAGTLRGGRVVAAIQNGLARTYVLLVAGGAVLVLLLFLIFR
jgi:NADH-quinone oxidoreductase subunit L